MSIDFYYMSMSSPCRSILMTARAVGASLNLKPTNPMAGENRTEEFLKVYDVTDALT
jgi:glutathione S-transferase